MKIKTEDLILTIVNNFVNKEECNERNIHNYTYFISKILDFKIKYKNHFMGPYSYVIDDEIGSCVSLGMINSVSYSHPKISFYKITKEGYNLLSDFTENNFKIYNDVIDILYKISVFCQDNIVDINHLAKVCIMSEVSGKSKEECLSLLKGSDYKITDEFDYKIIDEFLNHIDCNLDMKEK